jgi:diacylglycerol kinase family enzyme
MKQSVITVFGYHTRCSDVVYLQGRNITISSDVQGILSEIDGDPGPDLPLNIKVIPHAVKVMVPKDAKPAGIRTRIVRAIG